MAWNLFPVLSTPRLLLRELQQRDAAAWYALQTDPAVMRWYGADMPRDVAQVERLIADYRSWQQAQSGIRWGIELEGQLIGSCGFARINRGWHNAMLGYEIGPAWQGQGLMQEALQAILHYGFTSFQFHRIAAEIHHDNQASIKLVQKLGFRYEGVHREVGLWGGKWHDLDVFSLLEQEWEAQGVSAPRG
ncbi:GNAT family protein [Massilia sp. W12]|uniref:GNAT family N-acetyltransferase n=1 Tax=Massilia sp. W12 TaxID=3126507 RepID=UPI0030CC8CC0